ncbi:MAG: Regulatory protein AfsR [Chlamydiae bacterium]|nr:Regulatory protein AfsR [Chlamydiota bacterium]
MNLTPIQFLGPSSNNNTEPEIKKQEGLSFPNPLFVKRGTYSSQIQEAFFSKMARIVILTQEEGIQCKTGKTVIAKDYAQIYGNQFDEIFELQADSQLMDPTLLDKLHQNQNWLLVLDNVQSLRQLREAGFSLETLEQNGHILITSRVTNWNVPGATIVPVGLFSKKEAIQVLLKQFPSCPQETALKIVEALNFVPSSLCRAVEQIREWKISVENYLVMRLAVLEENVRNLPQSSYLPEKNPTFVGRELDLVSLEESLSKDKPLVLSAEVGLGGIGKTQLALQYAYRTAHQYQRILWIDAENESTFTSSYKKIANLIGIPITVSLVEDVNQFLQTHPGWLLIFDDVLHPDAIRNSIPKSGGHVLITSRNTSWEGLAQVFKVGVFKPKESVELIMKITELYGQEEDALELSNTCLHHLPLAVAQAAAFIRETKISIREYIELFQQARPDLWEDEQAPNDLYEKTVKTTWDLSMNRIAEEERVSLARFGATKNSVLPLMQSCSLFGPKDIPSDILLLRWIKFHLGKDKDLLELQETVNFLTRYSMVDLSREGLSIHSLVQTVVRDGLSQGELRALLIDTMKFFKKYQDDGKIPLFCYWNTEPKTINNLYRLLPHGLSLATHAVASGLKAQAIELFITIGAFSCHQGNFELAEIVLKRALDLEESAGVYKNLGNIYVNTGQLEKAEECYLKANDRDGAIQVMIRRKQFDRAEDMLREDIDRLRKGPTLIGSTNVRYFLGFNLKHLGYVLLKKGKPEQAIEFLKEAKQAFVEIYKPDNHFSAEVDYFIAQAYGALSDTVNQEKHLSFVIDAYEKTIQEDKPESIQGRLVTCYQILAILCSQRQDLSGARMHLKRAIHLSEIRFGSSSTNTIALRTQLIKLDELSGENTIQPIHDESLSQSGL